MNWKQDTYGLLCGVEDRGSWWKGFWVVESDASLIHGVVYVGLLCILRISNSPVGAVPMVEC